MIIVDDCSTDRTAEIVASFQEKDSRIKYLYNSTNKGSAFSRNIALQKAKGKWIAFLDSDDLWHPEKLEKQIEFMTRNDIHFSYTNYCEIEESSKEIGVLISGPEVITNKLMRAYCWPGCLTVMYDAEFLGLMQTAEIKINEEYALWIKISSVANCHLLDENLAKYRRHNNSLTDKSYLELTKWHYIMFRVAEGKNIIASLLLTLGNLIFGTYKKIFFRKKYKI
jgi:glycosyltransferase involved in cell wall biosynthesis